MTASEIIQEAMEAAGMDRGADPALLPERIAEIRFAGSSYVPNSYPRRERLVEKSVERNRGRLGVAIGNRQSQIL